MGHFDLIILSSSPTIPPPLIVSIERLHTADKKTVGWLSSAAPGLLHPVYSLYRLQCVGPRALGRKDAMGGLDSPAIAIFAEWIGDIINTLHLTVEHHPLASYLIYCCVISPVTCKFLYPSLARFPSASTDLLLSDNSQLFAVRALFGNHALCLTPLLTGGPWCLRHLRFPRECN